MDELGRQIIHMIFGALLLFIANFAGRDATIILLCISLVLGLILVQLKTEGYENRFVDFMLKSFDRPEKIPARGGLAFLVGTLFLFAAVDFAFAMGILAILAFGDGFATIVGMAGTRKIPFNQKKTFEGLGAFILAGVASSMFFLGWQTAVFYSVFLGIIESIDLKADDNLLIPFSAVLLKTLLK